MKRHSKDKMTRKGKKKGLLALALMLSLITGLVVDLKLLPTMEVYGAEQTGTKSNVTHAATEKYKDMDYSFLKTFSFGYAENEDVNVIFETATDMIVSNDVRIRIGSIVRTRGYYEVNDGGGALYEITESSKTGSIPLSCGLFANLIADTCTVSGEKWVVVNVKQLGAAGDGVTSDNNAISNANLLATAAVEASADVERGIVYIPAGEYKCTNQLNFTVTNINIVGEGDRTVIFTDNDYRLQEGYSEFFISVWGASNSYIADFRVEAREVDLYNYMRQFVFTYCTDVYLYNVDLIVPQEAYSAYYFEDKQYSNLCCYTGNKNITVDGCTLVQMSGTYRGANVGVMDIWSAGEENIVIMNCDMYGNARDEQIGVHNPDNSSSYIHNVEFLDNTMHFYQPKYVEVVGNATMRVTVGYANSNSIDNVRFAGNHFIAECDSKFMTFGTLTNCVIEDNIIEVDCTYSTWSMVFDSSNGDSDNIQIINNELYITTNENRGKGNLIGGKLTFEHNRVFSDTVMAFGILGEVVNYNEFICLAPIGKLTENTSVIGNSLYLYAGYYAHDVYDRMFLAYRNCDSTATYECKDNIIYNYKRDSAMLGVFQALIMLDSDLDTLIISGNEYYAPNTRFTSSQLSPADTQNEDGEYDNRLFRVRNGRFQNVIVTNNIFQGVKVETESLVSHTKNLTVEDNTYIPFEENLEEELVSHIDIEYNGGVVNEITTTDSNVDLDALVYIASEKDEEGNVLSEEQVDTKEIRWYSTVEGMATVSEDGVVTRQQYGDVKIYAVSLDGSTNYGSCTIHFQKNNATDVVINKDTLDMQVGYRAYADYTVVPDTASGSLEWSSSDESIATVTQSGMIEAQALGTAIITCKTMDGSNITRTITVNVTETTTKRITLNQSYVVADYTDIGTAYQLQVSEFYPTTAVNQEVGSWESTDENIVTVDENGLVTITGNGVAMIKANSTDGQCYGSCTFYVQPPAVENLTAAYSTYWENTLTLTWDAVDNCYGYYIYMLNNETGEYEVLNNGNYVTYTNFSISGLDKGKDYTFCVRSFITRWDSTNRYLYESEDATVDFTIYSYTPVTSYSSLPYPVENICEGDYRYDGWFQYGPSDANYEGLEFYCYTEDESIAKVTEVTQSPYWSNRYNYTIYGVKSGITKLIITSNDEYGVVYEVPVGILPAGCILKRGTLSADVSYRHLTLTFDGLEDETGIDGYMVRRATSAVFYDVEFIPKEGLSTYTFEQTDDIEDGRSYNYAVVPVMYDEETGTYFRAGENNTVSVTFPEAVLVTGIQISEEVYNIPMDTTGTVNAVLTPENADYKELIYTIMDSKTAYAERTAVSGNTNTGTITPKRVGVTSLEIAASDVSNVKKYVDIVISPAKTEALVVTPMANAMALSWEETEGAEGYIIYRYNDATGAWDRIADVKTSQYADTNLENDMTYRYKIAGYITYNNKQYEGSLSDEVSATTFLGEFDISISGYEGVYDGNYHDAVILNSQLAEGDTLAYSLDFVNWTQAVPQIKNVSDSTAVYVKEHKNDGSEYMSAVTARISKSPVTPNMPSNSLTIPSNKSLVSDAALPADWEWQIGEGELSIDPGESIVATAVYTGADKGNYETETLSITVYREECRHTETNLINAVAATCETDGYTGDYQCKECGEIIQTGTVTAATGHDWNSGNMIKAPTTVEEGVIEYICNICGAKKQETIEATGTDGTTSGGDSVTGEDGLGGTAGGDGSGGAAPGGDTGKIITGDNTVTGNVGNNTDTIATESSNAGNVDKKNSSQEAPTTGDKVFGFYLCLFISSYLLLVMAVLINVWRSRR